MKRTAWEWITGREPDIATVFAILFLFVSLVAYIHQTGITADGLAATLDGMKIPMLFVLGLSLLLSRLRKSLIGMAATAFVLLYFGAALKQFLFAEYPPPLPPYACFWDWYEKGCPASPDYTETAVTDASTRVVIATGTTELSSMAAESGDVLSRLPDLAGGGIVETVIRPRPEPTGPEPVPAPVISAGRIYVQFAGSITRDQINTVSGTLETEGWDMQAAERIATAAGLNEVRYFHAEDKAAADSLAQSYISSALWTKGVMEVRNLSTSKYNPPVGQLEIWTSN